MDVVWAGRLCFIVDKDITTYRLISSEIVTHLEQQRVNVDQLLPFHVIKYHANR